MTRAIVVGAGVAGPVAAMALQRIGVDATVYEAYAGDAGGVGSFLTMQANGIDALRAIDAADAVESLGFATARWVPRTRSAAPSAATTCTPRSVRRRCAGARASSTASGS
jgi:2-polyprenyl-6-methoxyphenol hydroxylase-like FAD-dependent oxidoreductase